PPPPPCRLFLALQPRGALPEVVVHQAVGHDLLDQVQDRLLEPLDAREGEQEREAERSEGATDLRRGGPPLETFEHAARKAVVLLHREVEVQEDGALHEPELLGAVGSEP
ncbi:unnamed protein product, partial [Ectocarpus sp. 13 AM-2016]